MSNPIFYASVDEIENAAGRISLHGGEARHLLKSQRKKRGESILVEDGMGIRYEATVTSVGPDEVCARIDSRTEVVREVPALTLIQAVSKLQHMDENIGRAAETGAEHRSPGRGMPSGSGRRPARRDTLHDRDNRWAGRRFLRRGSRDVGRAWMRESEHG